MASISTPFELALRHELEGEYVRMANEWFFPWHNLNIEGRVVDVEDFYGGRFHTGGSVFRGRIQDLYWRSVSKYLLDKTHEVFRRWKEATQEYPADLQEASLEGTALDLRSFVRRIVEHAVSTDQRLRGRGFPEKVRPYNATGVHSNANAEIERLRAAHLLLLPKADDVEAEEWSSGMAPASNRVVPLDHNSATYLEAAEKLTAAVAVVRANNEYAATDPEDYGQRLAELEGGQRLLAAPRVRLDAITATLIKTLKWLAVKFADNLAGILITSALTALAALLGLGL